MVTIQGGSPAYQRQIRAALEMYPSWLLRAARISSIDVTRNPEVRSQIAQFEHGSRKLYVADGIGNQLLNRAIGHELAHAVDDTVDGDSGSPHFFTANDNWRSIHRDQQNFDIPKYADEPLEYFADLFQKYLAFGYDKVRLTHPAEADYFAGYVEPTIKQQYGE